MTGRGSARRLRWGVGQRSDSGASLVLVLIFLLLGSLLVGGLATMVSNDLLNSGNLAKVRSLTTDATSAIDVAVQSIRYHPLLSPTGTLNASPPTPCWPDGEPTSPLPTTGGNQFHVWCSTRWTPTSADTRTVTLSACLPGASPATCAHHPVVQEVVSFDDYPPGGAPPIHTPCETYCGESMTVDSWVEHPTTPSVRLLSCAPSPGSCEPSPLGGPIAGGANITITGTGFVECTQALVGCGTTVQFVEDTGGAPSADNEVVAATPTQVHIRSSTSMTVTAPAVTEGLTYFVRVTTPSGSSADSSADVFTYTDKPTGTHPSLPTVTRICTGPPGTGHTAEDETTCNLSTNHTSTNAKGAVSGGTELTIWGTNFFCQTSCSSGGAPAVKFTPVSTGTTPTKVVTATYVTVVSDTEITATTPTEFQTLPAEYYVTVTTPAATSAKGAAFDYVAIVPTVERITGPSGSPQTVTVKGSGFVETDDTVGFTTQNACGGSTIANSVTATVGSGTTITATVPTTLVNGHKYFVRVHSSAASGTSTCYPSFTYST